MNRFDQIDFSKNPIEKSKAHYHVIESLLEDTLQQMIQENIPITVSGIAKRCQISRSTVYGHKSFYKKMDTYRKIHFQNRFMNNN